LPEVDWEPNTWAAVLHYNIIPYSYLVLPSFSTAFAQPSQQDWASLLHGTSSFVMVIGFCALRSDLSTAAAEDPITSACGHEVCEWDWIRAASKRLQGEEKHDSSTQESAGTLS
jgi:hypothetical protein